MNSDLFLTGLLQGLILALTTYGVMIPFRILHFADLTAEGAYPLGGAISASLLLMGCPIWICIVMSAIGAGLLGVATSLIHLRLKVNSLLSGIILSTMIYSVNLRLMGRPNIALFNQDMLFNPTHLLQNIVIVSLILMAMVFPLTYFLKTEMGLMMRAVGLNPSFSKRQGISVAKYTILGLFFGGCFTGLSGGLMVELQQYADVGMGVGIVIHALAALMLGEVLLGNDTLNKQLFSPLLGALVYQQIQGVALSVGLAPTDLKCFTGFLVLLVIAMKQKGAQDGFI